MTDRQQFITAEKLLFHTIESIDPVTGAKIQNWVETSLYREYRARQAAYEAAQQAYAAAQREAQRRSPGQSSWTLRASQLHQAVKRTHDRWRAEPAAKIEEAEALLMQLSTAEAI